MIEQHDALCPALNKALVLPQICTYCEIIRATRLDEQAKCDCGECVTYDAVL